MTPIFFLVIIIILTNSNDQYIHGNWIIECQLDKNKALTNVDVCLKEFNQFIGIFRQTSTDSTQHLASIQSICPSSNIWKSLVQCTCKQCHNTFFVPDDLSDIWEKYKCNLKNLNQTIDLCLWIKTAVNDTNSNPQKISSKQLTLKELESKMKEIIINFHRYKSLPTIQNIQEFFNLFKQIIDGIINLHLTTTKVQVLKQWEKNVTNTFETFVKTASNIKSEESAILNGLKTIESKENEMIEDLQILQQLENHFNIPRAQKETKEIFQKFKNLIFGVQQIHDKHILHNNSKKDDDKMQQFWERGLYKLQMAANILSIIANETDSINKRLDQYKLESVSVRNIETKIENDLQDDQHELFLKEPKEFKQIIQEMRTFSNSNSYQNAINKMEQLSKEWRLSTQRIMKDVEIIESKISNVLHHIQTYNYNNSKQFTLDQDIFYAPEPILDIDDIFKQIWQHEMKRNNVNRTNISLKYDDSSTEEPINDHKSGSIDMMQNKKLIYGWTVIVGAIVICFSFFMYLK